MSTKPGGKVNPPASRKIQFTASLPKTFRRMLYWYVSDLAACCFSILKYPLQIFQGRHHLLNTADLCSLARLQCQLLNFQGRNQQFQEAHACRNCCCRPIFLFTDNVSKLKNFRAHEKDHVYQIN